MFKRVLAKLGVGSATVNLVLDKDEYTLGDTVEGQILVEGGTVEQRINKIDVDLVLSVRVKEKVFSHTVDSASFHTPFRVAPSEKKVFPFTFSLPSIRGTEVPHRARRFSLTCGDFMPGSYHPDRIYGKSVSPFFEISDSSLQAPSTTCSSYFQY